MAIFTSFLYVYWRLPGGFTSIRLHPVSLAPARCPMTSMSLIGSGQRRGTLQWKLWFNQDFNGDVIWFHGIYSWFMIAKLNRIPITRAARVDRRYIMIYLYSCHDLYTNFLSTKKHSYGGTTFSIPGSCWDHFPVSHEGFTVRAFGGLQGCLHGEFYELWW